MFLMHSAGSETRYIRNSTTKKVVSYRVWHPHAFLISIYIFCDFYIPWWIYGGGIPG